MVNILLNESKTKLSNLIALNLNTEIYIVGVQQGSILGLLLFTIYINDMHQSVTSSKMHHFADDTNILFSNKNPKVMEKILNQELKSVFEWLCANRHSINVTFKPPKRLLNQRIVLKLNGKKIF